MVLMSDIEPKTIPAPKSFRQFLFDLKRRPLTPSEDYSLRLATIYETDESEVERRMSSIRHFLPVGNEVSK